MRKIQFNAETIEAIRSYIQEEKHTINEACNRFTLKYDTMKRVMKENHIEPYFINKRNSQANKPVDPATEAQICTLFSCTNTRLRHICKECRVEYYQMQSVLDSHFSKQQQAERKSKLYRISKTGDNNPMKKCTGSAHPNYIGIISDGQGYLQCLKPEWYTGRIGSKYVYVHQLVMCEHLGITEIPRGFVVHHIDGDTHNNLISNLALMAISGHGKLHGIQRKLIAQGAETIR